MCVPLISIISYSLLDDNGNRGIAYGTIQHHVVWNDTNLRYIVNFNTMNQPIGKGGNVLMNLWEYCEKGYILSYRIEELAWAEKLFQSWNS